MLSPRATDWIATTIGSHAAITHVAEMDGSTSATLYRITVNDRGSTLELVLRRFTKAEWLAEEPDLAQHEAANLLTAAQSGLPIPKLIAVDEQGAVCEVPAVLMTALPGSVHLLPDDMDGWLRRQARVLPSLHQIALSAYPWTYKRYTDPAKLKVPPWTAHPERWQRLIDIVKTPPPQTRHCFIHRDYHPVNILWKGGAISGLVDWPNGCWGPAAVDVSHCRVNLASMYGVEVAERFLQFYRQAAGDLAGDHVYYDLVSLTEGEFDFDGVYPPWIQFGLRTITPELQRQRAEEYLELLLQRYDE